MVCDDALLLLSIQEDFRLLRERSRQQTTLLEHFPFDMFDNTTLGSTSTFCAYVATRCLLNQLGLQAAQPLDAPAVYNAYLVQGAHRCDTPVVLDTGCSTSVTPHLQDFISDLTPVENGELHGLSDSVTIAGIGWIEWPVRDVFGKVAIIRTRAFHIPSARVRLCSTQTYFQENHAGQLRQDYQKVVLTTHHDEDPTFPYDGNGNDSIALKLCF